MNRIFGLSAQFLGVFLVFTSLAEAQEARLLKMPAKMGEFLLKQARAGNQDALVGAVGKIDTLVEKGKVEELEWVSWNSNGSGKHTKNETVKITLRGEEEERETGVYYFCLRGVGHADRVFNLETAPDVPSYRIRTRSTLGKQWTPTFAYTEKGTTRVLLERFVDAEELFVAPTEALTIQLRFTEKRGDTGVLTWLSDLGFEGFELRAEEITQQYDESRKVLRDLGMRFSYSRKAGAKGRVNFERLVSVKPSLVYQSDQFGIQMDEGKLSQFGDIRRTLDVFKGENSTEGLEDVDVKGKWKVSVDTLRKK